MNLGLHGKVALITGGSQGIGLAVAEGLAAEGVKAALTARSADQLAAGAAGIRQKYGVDVLEIPADVSRADEIERVVRAVEQHFGGVDILINNAGIGSGETVMNASDEKWQYYWDLHVMAAVRLARGVAPLMRKRGGGVILHNASICAKQPCQEEPIYNVTKAALVMFSKVLAGELIGDHIRVNCINPGLILTAGWIDPVTKEVAGSGKSVEQRLNEIAQEYAPIGRFATPQELADFFVFLCSDRAVYCVGSEYYVDGGWLNSVA
jgi:NAD(P)-dependent dehydrogenase (short-subunit alcohol dehydrogenase family)